MLRATYILCLTAALLAGCAGAPAPEISASQAGKSVRLVGELTDNGLGCAALRAEDGTLYTLARDLEGSKRGQRLMIEGHMVKDDRCVVGQAVMPSKAQVLAPAPR